MVDGPTKAVIVTGADSNYFGMLRGLLRSLAPVEALKIVFDFGLTPEQRSEIARFGVEVVRFSYPHDFPARRQVEETFPGFGAMLVRPHLDQIVPTGHDIIVWIDADAWVQDPSCLNELADPAARGAVSMIPEIDRSYIKFRAAYRNWELERRSNELCLGREVGEGLHLAPVLNSGVFATHRASPLWGHWRRRLQEGLQRHQVIDKENRVIEQASFNAAICLDGVDVCRFPTTYNWMACLSLPAWDVAQQMFIDPNPPHNRIRILHLSTHIRDNPVPMPLTIEGRDRILAMFRKKPERNLRPWPPVQRPFRVRKGGGK